MWILFLGVSYESVYHISNQNIPQETFIQFPETPVLYSRWKETSSLFMKNFYSQQKKDNWKVKKFNTLSHNYKAASFSQTSCNSKICIKFRVQNICN